MAQVTHFMYGTSSTYRADAFTSASATNIKEGQITAAIAAAVADGINYVFVPASMLPYNASLVTFNANIIMLRESGLGAFDIVAYGATGDAVTDCTASIQAAVNAATAVGGSPGHVVWVPGNATYVIAGTVNVTQSLTIRGEGKYRSVIRTNSATANMFNVTATEAVEFSDLTLGTTVTRSAGACVFVQPASSWNNNASFKRINFSAPFVGIDFEAAAQWVVDDCLFSASVNTAIIVKNLDTPDSGDSIIQNSFFGGPSSALGGVGINQLSSGGLRVINNKFNGLNFHYLVQFNASTANVQITGNGFENAFGGCIGFNASVGIPRILITGNEFSVGANSTGINFADAGAVYSGVNIADNVFALLGAAGTIGMAITRATNFTLGTNTFLHTGTNTTGISFGTNNVSIQCARQHMRGVTAPFIGTLTNVLFEGWQGFQTTTEGLLVSGTDIQLGNQINVTLSAARVVGVPLNPLPGQRITITFIQNGTGGWAVTWNAIFKTSWVDTGNTLNKRSTIAYMYDGTNWNQDGAQTPYV